jgi:hypothetical protein
VRKEARVFTEKERLILKALLEEELQTIMSLGQNGDGLLNRYVFSLAKILSKIDVDEAESTGMDRFFVLDRTATVTQAV